jgi:hypothetical protein
MRLVSGYQLFESDIFGGNQLCRIEWVPLPNE